MPDTFPRAENPTIKAVKRVQDALAWFDTATVGRHGGMDDISQAISQINQAMAALPETLKLAYEEVENPPRNYNGGPEEP